MQLQHLRKLRNLRIKLRSVHHWIKSTTYPFPSIYSEQVIVIARTSSEGIFEESNVEEVGVEIDELKTEDFHRETVFKISASSWNF